jgi:hypothetical protein
MKKILLSLLLLISVNVFSQDQPYYLRAHNISFGVRKTQGEPIDWIHQKQECSILVECYKTKLIINSKDPQTYHILYQTLFEDNKQSWKCRDVVGSTCNVEMTSDPQYPGFLSVLVEYDDMIWFYICTKN